MSYFICAWVLEGEVFAVEAAMEPIVEDAIVETDYDFRIVAEVDGPYVDAGEIFPALHLENSLLAGLPFLTQKVMENQT